MSRHMLYRRLRILRDLGALRVEVIGLERESLYLLGPAAREPLHRLGLEPTLVRELPRQLAHHLPSTLLAARLRVATAKSSRFANEIVYLFERELRRRLGTHAQATYPDAAVRVASHEAGQVAVAVEIDSGSENPSYVAKKLGNYAALRGNPLLGAERWSVLLVVPTKRRLARLALAAWGAGVPSDLVYYAEGLPPADLILKPDAFQKIVEGQDGDGSLVPGSPFHPQAPR